MRCSVAYEAGVRSGGGRMKRGEGIRAHDTARSVRGRREVPPPSLGLATKASLAYERGTD